MLIGTYSPALVAVSYLVAILATYTALDLAERLSSAHGRAARFWIMGGSLAMGIGIWSMHFIGMLAFSLPIALGYDAGLTIISLLIAHCSLLIAHCSLLIAIGSSALALKLASQARLPWPRLAGGALVLGAGMAGMHYTGMAAARFPAGSYCAVLDGLSLTGDGLAYLVIVTTLSVLAIALLVSVLDARLEARTADLAHSLTAANQQLTRLALHDHLTSLPNRLLLGDRISLAMQDASENDTCFALMFIDLDGFKPINDAFGHQVGDQLLLAVAERLRSGLSAQDTLARIGGDEFVLLVPLHQASEAVAMAAAQVALLTEPFRVNEHTLRVSASVGVALYPEGGADPHQLLTNADAAMYHAKNSGKNNYCFFDITMNSNARKQLQVIQDLRMAAHRGEFRLFYQPKFDAMSGHPVGAEALVRWQHPHLGLLGPDAFIDLAEKTGTIITLGEWVLNEACRQMAQWYQAGFTNWRVAVNLSALQFCHGGLAKNVAALAGNGLHACSLTLEITESTAMNDADASMNVLQQLADMGVDISIDDFGTGYSSLMYLKRLPAHELKIDRGFVRDLEHDDDHVAIVSAIVALGQALGLRIVAEGVETGTQQAFLTRLGCDSLQGYLLGRPQPADRFIAEIRERAGLPEQV